MRCRRMVCGSTTFIIQIESCSKPFGRIHELTHGPRHFSPVFPHTSNRLILPKLGQALDRWGTN